jgi:hypothetical protein
MYIDGTPEGMPAYAGMMVLGGIWLSPEDQKFFAPLFYKKAAAF